VTNVADALKKVWFKWASTEDYPNTPSLTDDIDAIEMKIREEQSKNG